MSVPAKPFCCSTCSASIVTPPGEVMSSTCLAGYAPVLSSTCATPSMFLMTILRDSIREKPAYTPASTSVSTVLYSQIGPVQQNAVNVSNMSSVTYIVWPSALSTAVMSVLSSSSMLGLTQAAL